MPCYRCGSRQVDPDRGPSPWQRGVRHDRQVLVCPDCQVAHDWTAELDRCGSCGSVRLISRLGEVECRNCRWVRPASPPAVGDETLVSDLALSATTDLAEEVAQALGRVLGKPVTQPRW
ncbi:MAG TPA: hypothetical protein VLW50_05280 [Streptosporangiaceae bacterium]|nr:hypothetical protein [Streptosporangiaceae bacterium]